MLGIDWSVHWTWFHYFVPSLWGNGPEAVVQTVLYSVAAVVFIPPIRHWFAGHIKSIHDKLDGHHEELLQQAESHHEEVMQQAQDHHEAHMKALGQKKRGPNGRFV
jgi:hypothetical protein